MYRIVVVLLLAFACNVVSATTFAVTNPSVDLPDAVPGDGVCAATGLPAGNNCTLRAAIMEANAHAGVDAITVPSDAHIVLTRAGRNEDAGVTGDLDITDDLTISVPFAGLVPLASVDAQSIDRVFDILTAVDVTLSGLIITGGLADDAVTWGGGGIRAAGSGTLTISVSELKNNLANAGGAIYVDSQSGRSLSVEYSYLHDNSAADLGFTNAFGAAIKDHDTGPASGASISINNSTVSNNRSFGVGYPAAVTVMTPLSISNSTFDGNLSTAINVYNADAYLNHVTITGSAYGYKIGSFTGADTSTLRNTIIAGNSAADCGIGTNLVAASSYSLDSDDSCRLGGGTGNLINTDPKLLPLARRPRGLWPVHDLAGNSPALDHGDPLPLGFIGTCLATDQDGVSRPIDGNGDGTARCDMGAIEREDKIFANGFEMII